MQKRELRVGYESRSHAPVWRGPLRRRSAGIKGRQEENARAERVESNAFASVNHGELAGHGENSTLGRDFKSNRNRVHTILLNAPSMRCLQHRITKSALASRSHSSRADSQAS